jgi:seryl-tRNA synthetase
MQNDKGVIALKSYEERIAELDAKREQKEKELAQLKAKQKKLQQQQKALERKARTKRLIETGAMVESFLGRPIEQEDIEPIKQLIEYYRNKKQSGQLIHTPKLQSTPTSSEQK